MFERNETPSWNFDVSSILASSECDQISIFLHVLEDTLSCNLIHNNSYLASIVPHMHLYKWLYKISPYICFVQCHWGKENEDSTRAVAGSEKSQLLVNTHHRR